MLEKCEQATQGYVSSSSSSNSTTTSTTTTTTTTTTTAAASSNGTSNGNNCDGDSFSRDIQAFVQLLEKEKRPLLTNNAELDGLVSVGWVGVGGCGMRILYCCYKMHFTLNIIVSV